MPHTGHRMMPRCVFTIHKIFQFLGLSNYPAVPKMMRGIFLPCLDPIPSYVGKQSLQKKRRWSGQFGRCIHAKGGCLGFWRIRMITATDHNGNLPYTPSLRSQNKTKSSCRGTGTERQGRDRPVQVVFPIQLSTRTG